MGTRATIKFQDRDEIYYVYRGHDGHPENILRDIEAAVSKSIGRWSNPELGCLVTLFLAMNYDFTKLRLPTYEMTHCIHGDESFLYSVIYDERKKSYDFGLMHEE